MDLQFLTRQIFLRGRFEKGGDDERSKQMRKFLVMMDSMSDKELDGKIDLHKKNDPATEKRIRRIAAGRYVPEHDCLPKDPPC